MLFTLGSRSGGSFRAARPVRYRWPEISREAGKILALTRKRVFITVDFHDLLRPRHQEIKLKIN
jgi:hypothetical protein